MRKVSANQQRFLTDVQRLLSTLLYRDVADPRFNGVSITRVEASGKQFLTIWVYHNGETEQKACIDALNRMAPHFSHELRRALPKRRLPAIVFKWDSNFEKSGDVLQLLRDLQRP
ncbi:ribosome-binding factor A [Mariprofundus micogutta]|uniref:Ribosome-binding factor A n=1 Tax=Mariprofundus micogutta TaxID=1921010 RepID=A0A1L8CPU9_9PROT|nr:ribosome-binding factor A [Mariprofundus micogutta]GAV20903.1 ribosome-binding factor A [Mariprofundus micogutta]